MHKSLTFVKFHYSFVKKITRKIPVGEVQNFQTEFAVCNDSKISHGIVVFLHLLSPQTKLFFHDGLHKKILSESRVFL